MRCLITLFPAEDKEQVARISEEKTAGAKFTAPSRFTAAVDLDLYDGCETCLDRCFFDAIAVEDDVAQVDETECVGCGLCVVTCPTEALNLSFPHRIECGINSSGNPVHFPL